VPEAFGRTPRTALRPVATAIVIVDAAQKGIHNGASIHFGADMTTISIKDVPEQWADALRQRAARNHRSLQGELMSLIEHAVQQGDAGAVATGSPVNRQARVVGFDRQGHPIVRQGWKSVDQVVAELRAKYPDPIVDQLSSIDIIRQDRDSR